MIARGYIFCFIFLSVWNAFAQKGAKVIADARTRQPIDFVYVNTADDKSISLLSNKDGRLVLIADEKIRSWTFYKMGYRRLILSVSALAKNDTVFLQEFFIPLQDITVTIKAIDTVVLDKRFYVDDYLVLPNSDLLLITSKINTKGFDVAYYKKDKGITCRKKFKEAGGEHFFTDCLKNFHLVTANFSQQIFFDSDSSFDFLPAYSRSRFDTTLALCALKLDTILLMKYAAPPFTNSSGFVQYSPFLSYINVSRHRREVFFSVFYSDTLRQMIANEISDYQMIVRNAALLETRGMSGDAVQNSERLFFEKIAAPIYAPALLKNDTVVIFNFQQNKIVMLSRLGVVLKEVELNQKQFTTLRDFEVIYDNERQRFYLKTKKMDKACLQHINIYTGDLSPEIRLERTFAKNVQIHNGKIFYLVREKGWDDTCYLYQQN